MARHKTQKKRFPFIHNKLAQERDVEVEGGNLDSRAKESFARHGFKIIDLVRLGPSLLTTCRSAATNLLLRDRMVAKQLFARDGRTSAFISLEFSGEETCGEALYRLCHSWETADRLIEPALFSNYLIQIELIGEQK